MTFELSTLLVHGGETKDVYHDSVAPTLVRSKTYKQEFGEKAEYEYGRAQNPTRSVLEEKLSLLEGGGKAAVFSSGLAAECMLFMTLSPGDEIIIPNEVYGGTLRLLRNVFVPYGIKYKQSDFSTIDRIKKEITPSTKYFFIEALTNPSLIPIDLDLMNEVSKETGIPYIADMTFSPPCTTRAFEYGAYAVIHSISKYLSGHNDVLAGGVITQDEDLYERLKLIQKTVGAVLSPDEAYRSIQGIKTLQIRWEKVSENALEVANFLSRNKKISRVLYPGLESHKGHEIAKNQMKNGYGGVLSFEIESENCDLKKFVDVVKKNGVITYGESLASPETLLAYPYTMSHASLTSEEKERLKITPRLFRMSLGFESAEDIIHELEKGFESI